MSSFLAEAAYALKFLEELVGIKYGKGLPEKDRDPNGKNSVYGSNGIVGYHSETITRAPVIIVGRKGSVGAVNLSESNCWPIDTTFFIDSFVGEIEPKWLFYCLQTLDLTIHAQGPKPGIRRDLLYKLRIPVPPLDEQRRIVVRIGELTRRAEEARETSAAREKELDTFLQAAYFRMISDVQWKPLNQVASLVRRKIETKPDEEYEEMGIRSFGKGTFKKPILTGQQVGNKRIYRIHEGDLVFNNVFAWEGAIAVAQKEDHGRVGSHRFITYIPHEGEATSQFLCHHFLSERGLEDIRAASPGSAGRNRTLGLKKLEMTKVPVPDYLEQQRFAELAKRRRAIRREATSVEEELKIYHASLIAKALRGEL